MVDVRLTIVLSVDLLYRHSLSVKPLFIYITLYIGSEKNKRFLKKNILLNYVRRLKQTYLKVNPSQPDTGNMTVSNSFFLATLFRLKTKSFFGLVLLLTFQVLWFFYCINCPWIRKIVDRNRVSFLFNLATSSINHLHVLNCRLSMRKCRIIKILLLLNGSMIW